MWCYLSFALIASYNKAHSRYYIVMTLDVPLSSLLCEKLTAPLCLFHWPVFIYLLVEGLFQHYSTDERLIASHLVESTIGAGIECSLIAVCLSELCVVSFSFILYLCRLNLSKLFALMLFSVTTIALRKDVQVYLSPSTSKKGVTNSISLQDGKQSRATYEMHHGGWSSTCVCG